MSNIARNTSAALNTFVKAADTLFSYAVPNEMSGAVARPKESLTSLPNTLHDEVSSQANLLAANNAANPQETAQNFFRTA